VYAEVGEGSAFKNLKDQDESQLSDPNKKSMIRKTEVNAVSDEEIGVPFTLENKKRPKHKILDYDDVEGGDTRRERVTS